MTLRSDFTADAFVGADAGRNDQTAAVLFHIGFRAAVCRCMGNVFGRLNHIAGRINHGTFLINIAVGSDGGVAASVDVGYMRCVRYGRCIRFGAGNADRYADACNVIFSVCGGRYAQIGYAAGFGYSAALTVTFELEDNWVFLPVKMLPLRPTEWVLVWVSVNLIPALAVTLPFSLLVSVPE